MKIGILGPKGRTGKLLVEMGCTPIDIDITNFQEVVRADLNKFDVIINCAAKTNVDACQSPDVLSSYYMTAVGVNGKSLMGIREVFNNRLIHISTDHIFDCKKGPYSEFSTSGDCVNDYGTSKFAGEIYLSLMFDKGWKHTKGNKSETVIVRTTGLFGSGSDYASMLLQCLEKDEEVLFSNELHGNHTYYPHFCEALLYIAEMKLPERFMYLHVGSSDIMSRYDFALMLANIFGYSPDKIIPCKNKEIEKWIAPRPTKGGLLVKKAKKLGVPIYSTLEGLEAYKEQRSK